jgi:hypothetical protein
MQYTSTTRVNTVLHAGWYESMRLEPGQYGYQYGIEILVKIFNMTKTFFSAVSYSRNPSGIDTGYDAGLYGRNRVDTVLISYGPGSKSGCVWLHSRNVDLIVNYSDPFRPASNSWLTRTDPCRPAAANIKEKLVKLGQARVDLFRTAATPTDPYLPFSYSGDQLLNPCTKTMLTELPWSYANYHLFRDYSGTFSPASNSVLDPAVYDCSI